MFVFLQCVAEAVAEKGLRGVAEMVIPGGGAMFDIAEATWEKYRMRCKEAKQREEIQALAVASFAEAKEAAVAIAQEVCAKQPKLTPVLEVFLTQIPGSIRQSLKRSDDPTGTTIPAAFTLRGPEDVAKLLPSALPRFKPGDPLAGLPGWFLIRQIGIGGFGEVWLARKKGFDSLVGAVKFCRDLNVKERNSLRESKIVDQVLRHGQHPNIVKLMNVHLEGETPWLMYEYVDGGDLTDLIHEWSSLPPAERQQKAIAALKELTRTIAHVHRLKIVHRDLKPANILRDKKGRLRITDFGISGLAAKQMLENESRGVTTRAGRLQFTHSGSYTPLYASPQQKDGEQPDPRDDVHALGVIGYQMLTGQLNQGIGSDFVEDLKDAQVPDAVIELLRRCTASKVERRFLDAKTVEREIDAITNHVQEQNSQAAAAEEQRAREAEVQRQREDDAAQATARINAERRRARLLHWTVMAGLLLCVWGLALVVRGAFERCGFAVLTLHEWRHLLRLPDPVIDAEKKEYDERITLARTRHEERRAREKPLFEGVKAAALTRATQPQKTEEAVNLYLASSDGIEMRAVVEDYKNFLTREKAIRANRDNPINRQLSISNVTFGGTTKGVIVDYEGDMTLILAGQLRGQALPLSSNFAPPGYAGWKLGAGKHARGHVGSISLFASSLNDPLWITVTAYSPGLGGLAKTTWGQGDRNGTVGDFDGLELNTSFQGCFTSLRFTLEPPITLPTEPSLPVWNPDSTANPPSPFVSAHTPSWLGLLILAVFGMGEAGILAYFLVNSRDQ